MGGRARRDTRPRLSSSTSEKNRSCPSSFSFGVQGCGGPAKRSGESNIAVQRTRAIQQSQIGCETSHGGACHALESRNGPVESTVPGSLLEGPSQLRLATDEGGRSCAAGCVPGYDGTSISRRKPAPSPREARDTLRRRCSLCASTAESLGRLCPPGFEVDART